MRRRQLVLALTRATVPLIAVFLVLSSGSAGAQNYEVPRRGQWVTGPHMSRRDLSDDAITSGAFSLGATNSIATVYVACKGVESGAPVLELRASVPAFPGSAAISPGAEITVGDFVKTSALEVIPLSAQVIFVAELDRRQITALAKDNSDDLGGLSIGFTAGALSSFVAGLGRDHAAVEAAFYSSWSNGQVEGQVHRLKLLKRQIYGRAGFVLLRRRVLPLTIDQQQPSP